MSGTITCELCGGDLSRYLTVTDGRSQDNAHLDNSKEGCDMLSKYAITGGGGPEGLQLRAITVA